MTWALNGLPTAVPIRSIKVFCAEPNDVFLDRSVSPGEPLTLLARTPELASLKIEIGTVVNGKPVTREWTLDVPAERQVDVAGEPQRLSRSDGVNLVGADPNDAAADDTSTGTQTQLESKHRLPIDGVDDSVFVGTQVRPNEIRHSENVRLFEFVLNIDRCDFEPLVSIHNGQQQGLKRKLQGVLQAQLLQTLKTDLIVQQDAGVFEIFRSNQQRDGQH